MSVISTGGRSAKLSLESNTRIPEGAQIRCRHDYIIVEPLEIDYQVSFQVVEDIGTIRGVVKAVGPGIYRTKYDHPDKHKRTKMWKSDVFTPTEVKVGDIVELGAIYENGRLNSYSWQTIIWGDRPHIVCSERDVSGVIDGLA